MNRRAFFLAGAAAAVAPLALPSCGVAASTPLSQRGGVAYFTNAELSAHDGQTVRFYDDLVKGKVVLINFMYTECGDICPGMTQNLAEVQKLLGDRVGRDIFMYSFTLQPEKDTPERLKAYAEIFDVKPGWLFLTGAPPISNCCAGGSASAIQIRFKMLTSISTSVSCASATSRSTAGSWRRRCCVRRPSSRTSGW